MHEFDRDSNLVSSRVLRYDNPGNLVEEISYNQAGIVTAVDSYRYDTQSRLVERTAYYSSKRDNYREKATYDYDSNGLLIKQATMFANGNAAGPITINKYDLGRQLIETAKLSPDNVVEERIVFAYDKKGSKTREDTYGYGNQLRAKLAYIYDAKGNLVKVLYESTEKNMDYSVSYSYGKAGLLAEKKEEYSASKLVRRTRYVYQYSAD